MTYQNMFQCIDHVNRTCEHENLLICVALFLCYVNLYVTYFDLHCYHKNPLHFDHNNKNPLHYHHLAYALIYDNVKVINNIHRMKGILFYIACIVLMYQKVDFLGGHLGRPKFTTIAEHVFSVIRMKRLTIYSLNVARYMRYQIERHVVKGNLNIIIAYANSPHNQGKEQVCFGTKKAS
ncbi:hypothetical protein ACJX0J_012595, partial [Zea mays]